MQSSEGITGSVLLARTSAHLMGGQGALRLNSNYAKAIGTCNLVHFEVVRVSLVANALLGWGGLMCTTAPNRGSFFFKPTVAHVLKYRYIRCIAISCIVSHSIKLPLIVQVSTQRFIRTGNVVAYAPEVDLTTRICVLRRSKNGASSTNGKGLLTWQPLLGTPRCLLG